MKQVDKHVIALFGALLLITLSTTPIAAQSIIPDPNGTGTIVTPNGDRLDIHGGQLSGDRTNLFHSLTRFGLTQQQIANFLSDPNIRNILVRINGGEASFIDGLVQVSGSNANLYIMNPSGIVFGNNARLNVPASFTATTANGIGFGATWFNAYGDNNYVTLNGVPNQLAFTMPSPNSIVNYGNLTVKQDLTLVGGEIVSPGQLNAPNGNVTLGAVPGNTIVRINLPNSILSFEFLSSPGSHLNDDYLSPSALPQLLTGGSSIANATSIQVNQDGSIRLSGSGISAHHINAKVINIVSPEIVDYPRGWNPINCFPTCSPESSTQLELYGFDSLMQPVNYPIPTPPSNSAPAPPSNATQSQSTSTPFTLKQSPVWPINYPIPLPPSNLAPAPPPNTTRSHSSSMSSASELDRFYGIIQPVNYPIPLPPSNSAPAPPPDTTRLHSSSTPSTLKQPSLPISSPLFPLVSEPIQGLSSKSFNQDSIRQVDPSSIVISLEPGAIQLSRASVLRLLVNVNNNLLVHSPGNHQDTSILGSRVFNIDAELKILGDDVTWGIVYLDNPPARFD
ncbi:filamentous hemagglutinin N-terminal domain-containing protein [Pantanalinema rosaneae CENA516]|uniref:filamentous hemagglutinin N-terminal domain-containing protein n=1 Tax=Pantanalinema rosaneae TaxID=1620701 RepID=UPI003D6E8F37